MIASIMSSLSKKIIFWTQNDSTWNYGDALTYLLMDIFSSEKFDLDVYHLIGSVIADECVKSDLKDIQLTNPRIAYWCCGARSDHSVSNTYSKNMIFFGARGPLTRRALNLPHNTTIGDPAIILPIIYPKKNICRIICQYMRYALFRKPHQSRYIK
jgi:hypothetical protein